MGNPTGSSLTLIKKTLLRLLMDMFLKSVIFQYFLEVEKKTSRVEFLICVYRILLLIVTIYRNTLVFNLCIRFTHKYI